MKYIVTLIIFLFAFYVFRAQDGLQYFNSIREKVGLIPLRQDPRLDRAILWHCKYMSYTHELTHKESPGNQFFRGKTPDQRAVQAGMNCRYVAENLTFNQENSKDAIDDLISTVYHRFSLLSPEMDIAGFASFDNYYGLLLSNSYLDSLCRSFTNDPDLVSFIYVTVCDLYQKKVPLLDYVEALEKVQKQNADIIVYPYPGQQDIPVSFSEEEPNPVPKCFIVGYPITVEFNPYYHPLLPTRVSIKLRDSKGKIVPGRFLTASNDPHHKLTLYQYSFIPRNVLSPGEKYWVELKYTEGGVKKKKLWSFTTVSFPAIFELNGQKTIYVPSPSEFYVMVEPRNCRDTVFNHLQVKYSTDYFNVEFVGSLFLRINIRGRKEQFAQIDLENGYSLRIIILGE